MFGITVLLVVLSIFYIALLWLLRQVLQHTYTYLVCRGALAYNSTFPQTMGVCMGNGHRVCHSPKIYLKLQRQCCLLLPLEYN